MSDQTRKKKQQDLYPDWPRAAAFNRAAAGLLRQRGKLVGFMRVYPDGREEFIRIFQHAEK